MAQLSSLTTSYILIHTCSGIEVPTARTFLTEIDRIDAIGGGLCVSEDILAQTSSGSAAVCMSYGTGERASVISDGTLASACLLLYCTFSAARERGVRPMDLHASSPCGGTREDAIRVEPFVCADCSRDQWLCRRFHCVAILLIKNISNLCSSSSLSIFCRRRCPALCCCWIPILLIKWCWFSIL